MTRLAVRLRELIAAEGPIGLDRYMALCLGDPIDGYYMKRDPFGIAGDFVTAPEISQIFGELIGLWAGEVWARMGRPDTCNLVELGPGRGTLMADALRALRILPGALAALRVELIETSPALRAKQRESLAKFMAAGGAVQWRDRLEDAPPGRLILIANEFFDALPIRQFQRHAGRWRERCVGLGEGDRLTIGLGGEAVFRLPIDAPQGSIREVSASSSALLGSLSGPLFQHVGAALIIDYGYVTEGFGDTLQAMRAHRYVNPLDDPGEADLTAHVDFPALAAIARQAGLVVEGPVGQGAFLEALGLAARAEKLAQAWPDRAGEFAAARARLAGAGEGQMGELFKAMVLRAPGLAPTPGPWPTAAEH